jgi:hypothetical protein
VLVYVSLAGQSVAVVDEVAVAGIVGIVGAVEVHHRRNIFDEVVEVERTLL